VAILDADKEGFLRSETSLIQTCGRAARNADGRVIMYCEKMTKSIQNTIDTTQERRAVQKEHNKAHGIIPKTIRREKIEALFETFEKIEEVPKAARAHPAHPFSKGELTAKIANLEFEMKRAAKDLRFEDAAHFRDQLQKCKKLELL
jgi:excinuclease ABC subunit B